MAAKNEIKHRISLEGDEDVRRRLKAVAEVGKQSQEDIERRLGAARSVAERSSAGGLAGGLGKLRAPAEVLGGALSPFAEGTGVAGLLGRLKGFFTSPAGIFGSIAGALSGIALHMAKVADETERAKGRFKALGDAGGLDKVSAQAKKLGTDVSNLTPAREGFLAYAQKQNAKNRSVIHPSGFVPGAAEESAAGVRVLGAGPSVTTPANAAFDAFHTALFAQLRRDIGNSDDVKQIADDFEQSIYKNGLTSDSLQSLQKASPHAANFVTDSLSQLLGRGFSNPAELATLLDRGVAKVSAPDLIREGAKHAPEADKEAQAARGVTEALESAKASLGRFDKAVSEVAGGKISKGITGALDKATGGADQVMDHVPDAVQALQRPGPASPSRYHYDSLMNELNGYFGPVSQPEPAPPPAPTPASRSGRTLDGPEAAPPPQVQPTQPSPPQKFEYIPPPSPEERRRLDRDRGDNFEYIPAPSEQPPPSQLQRQGQADQPQQDVASNAAAFNEATSSSTQAMQQLGEAVRVALIKVLSPAAAEPATVNVAGGGEIGPCYSSAYRVLL